MSEETRVSEIQKVETAIEAVGYEIIDIKKERCKDFNGDNIKFSGAIILRIIPRSNERAPESVSENQLIATALEAIRYEIDEFKKEGLNDFFKNKIYNGVIALRITPRVYISNNPQREFSEKSE